MKAKSRKRHLMIGFYSFITVLLALIIGSLVYMIRAGGGTLPVLGQSPGLTAENVDGKTVSLQDFNGKIVLITWFYTHCTDECPLTMYRFEQIQQALQKQGTFGKKVVLVAMTLDPARDTQPIIKQYASHFNADFHGWYFLRTSPDQTMKILNAWGVKVKPSTDQEFIEHTLKTALIDQNGNIRAEYNTANLNPQQVLSDINGLVARMNWGI